MSQTYDFTDVTTFEKWDSKKDEAYKKWLEKIAPEMEKLQKLAKGL